MTTFLFLVQLLFIGTLIIPAYAQTERCNLLLNATSSNFTVIVTPEAYKANTAYTVKIDDDRNLTNSNNVTKYLLQALSPQNVSVGEWDVVDTDNCSSIDTAVLNATQKTANWTSPGSNVSSVEIRAYIIFADKYATFKTVPLNKGTLNSYKQEDRLIYFCRIRDNHSTTEHHPQLRPCGSEQLLLHSCHSVATAPCHKQTTLLEVRKR
ncbi:placenta-expressed transcript 1 protein-like isoform X2 [Phalacrocorax aristotelis]|uniref:placenta-expressed transcript 1 protein-like isoform X2 n=1 Tax=Phalacrocorax aristotelis TaxID=126867 RepID=UPI003F4B0EA7